VLGGCSGNELRLARHGVAGRTIGDPFDPLRSVVEPGGNARSRSSNVDAAIASSIVEVESKIAPRGEVSRRGGSTSRRIGGCEDGQDIRGGSRCTSCPLGRFVAALTMRYPRAPGSRAAARDRTKTDAEREKTSVDLAHLGELAAARPRSGSVGRAAALSDRYLMTRTASAHASLAASEDRWLALQKAALPLAG
jgi:hypothetical protein